jgi:hypothetical protein
MTSLNSALSMSRRHQKWPSCPRYKQTRCYHRVSWSYLLAILFSRLLWFSYWKINSLLCFNANENPNRTSNLNLGSSMAKYCEWNYQNIRRRFGYWKCCFCPDRLFIFLCIDLQLRKTPISPRVVLEGPWFGADPLALERVARHVRNHQCNHIHSHQVNIFLECTSTLYYQCVRHDV